jgi:PAS domain S-box-containing protein
VADQIPDDEEEMLRSVALQNANTIFAVRNRDEEFRAHLAAVVESSEDAIISKTLDGIIRSWNTGAQRIFGYTADEAIGKSITMLIPPDRIQEEGEIIARLRRGERIEHYETVRVRKDGSALEISLSVSPIRDSTGAVIGASKIARDVTAAKRLLQALQESEGRLRAVVEATPECVKIVSPEGLLTFMNAAGLGMIETEAFESVRGACVFDLIAPEHRRAWIERHARVCAGEKLSWEFEIVSLVGTRRWMETHAVPLTQPDGRTGQLGVARDITARKHAEAEREQLLEAERSARAEAERVSLLKDEFLATLSHELRTPLSAILGWAQLLKTGKMSEDKVREGLAIIERNARVQTQLIEDLLDMSRVISGKLRLDVQSVDLQDVVRAAVESVRHSADAKDIRLHVVLDPLTGPVRGDPNRLQQCFWNLLSNAIKFTPKGGKVSVALEPVNSHVEVCIIDSGQGIKPEFLPHVFERFRQADGSTTRSHGGLGLGLSIVKHLVELHGGMIRAKSPGEGQGATFCIELPLMVVHPPAHGGGREHPRGTPLRSDISDHALLEGITVLVVDDEPDARELLKRVLEDGQARVLLAASAQEGLEILRRERPDMLVSDIGMPGEDGYQLIRRVRALPPDEGGRTPAAALTAFARAEDRTRALRAGYQIHVAKPVEPAELSAVVASLALRR